MKRYFFAVVVSALAAFPGVAAAFDVTDTAAYQVTDTTYLYMIEFEYGYLNAEAYLPIFPQRGETLTSDAPALAYELYNGDTTSMGTAAGVILSNAPVVNGQYTVAAGERTTFTLVVVQRAAAASNPELRVTAFEHLIKKDGTFSRMQPSATQLLDYRASRE